MTRFQRLVAITLSALTLSTLVAVAPAHADTDFRSDFGRRIIWVA